MKNFLWKITLMLVGSWMLSPHSLASVPDDDTSFAYSSMPQTAPIDENIFTKHNVEKYVPANLTPTKDTTLLSSEFQTKFQQKCLDNFFASDFFKKTPAGRAQTAIQQVSEKSMYMGATSAGITQEVKFQVRALQHEAEMDYKGYFNSSFVYTMDTSLAALTISKPLNKETTLNLTNSTSVSSPQFVPNLNLVYTF